MQRVHIDTGLPVTDGQIQEAHPGLLFSPEHDLGHLGYPWLVETERPETQEGFRVVRGPNELVEGQWQTTWIEYVPETEKVLSVTPRQAKRVLLQRNLLSLVNQAIENLEEPLRSFVKIDWEYAQEIRRDNETFIMLVSALGFTEEQIDMLFEEASKIV